MSLVRKASKGTLRLTTQDFSSSMDQKNCIIANLQSQLQILRPNQERVDRLKEQLMKAKSRYESLLRGHEQNLENNEERLDLSVRSVQELRIQAEHLNQEMKLKIQGLKEARYSTQQLVDFENRKGDESTECKIRFQQQKNQGQVLKMEQERTRLQISQLREEVQKGKKESSIIKCQTESITQKSYKTQSYIRGLLREESNLNESLSKIEDENHQLDGANSELNTVVSINQNCVVQKEKDIQEIRFNIANKELQKKKIQNQIRQKVKQLQGQKQKWRTLCEQFDQKRQEANRLQSHLSEASAEINFIFSKNKEIQEVNEQLGQDLRVCQKHQQNVLRNNKILDQQIQNIKETSLKAIGKLQQPFKNKTNNSTSSRQPGTKWGVSSRITDYQTGDFEKRSQRN